jgi:dTMP kinase
MLAYQGAGRVLDLDEVAGIAEWATDGLVPDLTVLLDLDPAEAVGAIEQPDRLEQAGADLHQRARRFFLELASREPERYLVLPAREPRDRIAAQVQQRVGELLSSAAGRIAT